MATHDNTTPTNPGRRALAGGGFAALLGLAAVTTVWTGAPVALAADNPDAELLDLCAEFHEAHTASHATDDESWEAHLAQRWEIFDEIEVLTPATDAGRMACAGVALVLMDEMVCVENAHERFARTALRGLVGRAGA